MKPDIIEVTEVQPKKYKERPIEDYTIQDYVPYPCDMEPSDERGIIIYVHCSLNDCLSCCPRKLHTLSRSAVCCMLL